MKFNEKLMELRKKEGLSQEELGYKLNVTRQTISEWELGQTQPEIKELLEISKIFNINVYNLINESEIVCNTNPVIEDIQIGEESDKENKVKKILIGVIVVVIILMVAKPLITIFLVNKATDFVTQVAENNVNAEEVSKNFLEKFGWLFGDISENVEEQKKEMDILEFNSSIKLHNGTQNGMSVKLLLDDIITSNKIKDRQITLKYKKIVTQETEEIKKLKKDINDMESYEISFEYDEDGYINKAIIEKE